VQPKKIGETEWGELQALLAPVSERYLRNLLRNAGIPMDPLVEGVRQDSFEHLERTMLALGEELALARRSGRREREELCRRVVIVAKDHARLAARRLERSPGARADKEEMIAWMRVWLENPEVFPIWLALRKRKLEAAEGEG